MPDFPHPPFAPTAMQQPRTLWRWLDINPLGGPLGRVQTYLTLPVFNIVGINYLGYSDIIQSYNFTCPNAFSFKPSSALVPLNPNCSLAISYVDKFGTVYRYFIWTAANAVFYFEPTYYSGQKIGRNCRFEIWSSGAIASQPTVIQFYTSVFGIQDYRYATDSDLVVFGSSCITPGFTYNGSQLDQGLPDSTTDWWISNFDLVSGTNWSPKIGSGSIATSSGPDALVGNDPAFGNYLEVDVEGYTNFTLTGDLNPAANFYFIMACDYGFGAGGGTNINLINSGAATVLTIAANNDGVNANITFNGTTINVLNYITGMWININAGQVTLTVYDVYGNVLGIITKAIAAFNVRTIQLHDVLKVYEVAHVPDGTFNFVDHLSYNYGGFKFPFTFAQNAVVPTNT